MDLNESVSKEDITYQDIRDDRVLTYFDLKKGINQGQNTIKCIIFR